MNNYLPFEIGDNENARGWSLIYICSSEDKLDKGVYKLVDVDGTALREALHAEICDGRLIVPNVFEPFYVKVSEMQEALSYADIFELAQREKRDLIRAKVEEGSVVSPEHTMEKMIARYTTICRENIYLRLMRSLIRDVFYQKRRIKAKHLYSAIFNIAYWTCLCTRARREEDTIEMSFARKNLLAFQSQIPLLDLRKLAHVLEHGNACEWHEMADYVDIFYLTLKKHFPFYLKMDDLFRVNEEEQEWFKEELPGLYEDYFLAVIEEKYEKAIEIKQLIDNYHTSQSVKKC